MNKTAQPQQLNGHHATAIVSRTSPGRDWFRSLTLSERTATMLDYVALSLQLDRVQVWELPAPIQCVYFAGVHHGEMRSTGQLREALTQAEYDRDRYYEQAHNSGKQFTEIVQRRIDQAAQRWEHLDSGREFFSRVLDEATSPLGEGGSK